MDRGGSVSVLAALAAALTGCASLNPLLPAEVEERGMQEAPLSLESAFDFAGATVGQTSILRLDRSALERGVQHVHLRLATPRATWRVECAQEARIEGTLQPSVAWQGRVCHATPQPDSAPVWTLALVGEADAPWRGLLADATSAWTITGEGLGHPDRVSPVVQVRDAGRLIAVWDEVAFMPRLWLDPALPPEHRERLEALGLLLFALDDLRDGYPDEGPTYNPLDAAPVTAPLLPPSPEQLQGLQRLTARLEAEGFPDGAALLQRQAERSRDERLEPRGHRAAARPDDLGRMVMEAQAGPLFGAGLGLETPGLGPSGLALQVGGGLRLSRQTQLVLGMGLDIGPYSTTALAAQSATPGGWSSAGFGFGLGARWTLPLFGPAELTLGAQLRGRLAFAELPLTGPDGTPGTVDLLQAGLGLAPLLGLQHATTWNDLGTRTLFFIEANPEWTAWLHGSAQGDSPRANTTADALRPLLEDSTFLLRVMMGIRLEL